ncbi:MAG TPA: hypothetical protein VEZ55_06890, partial [Chitinophagaceae bacterium]|nr:hypothetical protein [Chitinophagaceae bacterium]
KDVAIANETNKVLLELKSQGIAYDNVTSLRKVFNSNGREKFMLQNSTQLEFDKKGNVIREENTLILNKAFFDKHPTLDEVNKVAKGLRDRQWGTSESYKDMVWHEAGHRLTAKNIYINRTVANKESLVDDISRLGRYSKKNLDENLSEIFAFYKKTGDAPKEWKELFNKYSIIKI